MSGAHIPSLPAPPQSTSVLGVPIHLLDLNAVLAHMEQWIHQRDRCHWIYHANSHGINVARKAPDFMKVLRSADISLPDGKVTVWFVKRHTSLPFSHIRAVDLMRGFFALAERKGYSSFFYGDTEETLALLSEKLRKTYPALKIAGTFSPPFRPMTPEEDQQIVDIINKANPDVLWVGLGLPKQENWIYAHLEKLKVPVIAAVGVSFRFITGQSNPPPLWVSNAGIEWLWRFLHEPRRLWHRAMVNGPQFVFLSLLEVIGLKKFR